MDSSSPMMLRRTTKRLRIIETTSAVAPYAVLSSSISTMTGTPPPTQQRGLNRRTVRNVVTPMDCASSSSVSSSPSFFSTIPQLPIRDVVDEEYQDLYISPSELRPSRTLITGQCFNWRVVVPIVAPTESPPFSAANPTTSTTETTFTTEAPPSAWGTHNASEWIGHLRVYKNDIENDETDGTASIIVMIRETPTTTLYRTMYTSHPSLNIPSVLYSYFQVTPPPTFFLPLTLQQPQPKRLKFDETLIPMETVSSMDHVIHHQTHHPICLADLYQEWSTQCDRMKIIASHLPGVRILDQDPFYCMISFLCSSNNNIPRITKMLSSLQRTYGTRIATIPHSALLQCHSNHIDERNIAQKRVIGWDTQDIDPITGDMIWYEFPSLQQLIQNEALSESNLRTKCGMGYRANYLMETIQLLQTLGGEPYLQSLRSSTDPIYVQEQLLQFKGIGRKVADCIALFSLQQHNAIPVDVHVWNIARRDYYADAFLIQPASTSSSSTTIIDRPKPKSLTPTIYRQIGDLFRNKFPSYSGWAHSLLFVAELPSFRPALPDDIVNDMDTVRSNVP